MKKIFLIIALGLATISCSDDDNNKTAAPPAMLLTHFSTTSESGGLTLDYVLTYDDQNRLKEIVKTGDVSATLTYNYNAANFISSVDVIEGANEREIKFTYDSQNHLTSFATNDDPPTAIVYDAATQIYTIGVIQLKMNEAGDVLSTNTLKFGYAGLGSFAHVGGANIQLINNFVDGMFIFVGSRSAVQTINDYDGNAIYEITNTFNESGYPTTIIIDSQEADLIINAKLEYTPI